MTHEEQSKRIEQLELRFHSLLEKAENLFNVELSEVELYFNLTGRTALGQACKYGSNLYIRLNIQAVRHYYEQLLEDTLPHEVAHIVQYAKGTKGGHRADWKNYCAELGGNPSRIAEGDFSKLKPARRTRMWAYKAENSTEIVELTTIRHNKLQKGKVEAYLIKNGGKITKEGFIKEVK